MSPRSHSAGKRASKKHGRPSSKVRVYERTDVPNRFFMTRSWVLTPSGRPEEEALAEGVSWEKAKLLADRVAAERQIAILEGAVADTRRKAKALTLVDLLDKYDAWDATQHRSPRTMDDKSTPASVWTRTATSGSRPSSPRSTCPPSRRCRRVGSSVARSSPTASMPTPRRGSSVPGASSSMMPAPSRSDPARGVSASSALSGGEANA